MTWVKLDDRFHSNPKVMEAGLEAAGLYARSLSYCGDHLTDGLVNRLWLAQYEAALLDRITDADLWEPVEKGDRRVVVRDDDSTIDVVFKTDGFFIRDFLKHNFTKAEVEKGRTDRSAKARKAAQKRWELEAAKQEAPDAKSNAGSNASSNAARNAPVPGSSSIEEEARARAGADAPPARPARKPTPPTRRETHPHVCPTCTCDFTHERILGEHLEIVHDVQPRDLEAALAAIREGRTR